MSLIHHAVPKLAFTDEDLERASREWGCNCGPAALAAMLGRTPDEVRPALHTFKAKRYLGLPDMEAALLSLGVDFRVETGDRPPPDGLARVQFAGPWLAKGVPLGARLARTHWVASRCLAGRLWIYDVNAGWQDGMEWAVVVAPRLADSYPRSWGSWFFDKAIHVSR